MCCLADQPGALVQIAKLCSLYCRHTSAHLKALSYNYDVCLCIVILVAHACLIRSARSDHRFLTGIAFPILIAEIIVLSIGMSAC